MAACEDTKSSWEGKEGSSCRDCARICESKLNEQAEQKHSSGCTVVSVSANEDGTYNYPPEKVEKRRLSLDFFFGRRSSHGKLKINREKRGSTVSTTETSAEENVMPSSHERRRSSTRMEGNSDLVAWCFI